MDSIYIKKQPRIRLARGKREEIYLRITELVKTRVRYFSPPMLRSRKILSKVLASEKFRRVKSPKTIQRAGVKRDLVLAGKVLTFLVLKFWVVYFPSFRELINPTSYMFMRSTISGWFLKLPNSLKIIYRTVYFSIILEQLYIY